MTSQAMEEAFQRLPRPQVPTKAALLERSFHNSKQPSLKNKRVAHNPWELLSRQGDLTQGVHIWSVCIQAGHLVMVKKIDADVGYRQLEKVKKLSDHPNVATIRQVFEWEGSLLFQFEYTRSTLEEVLNVHSCLKEPHIRVIASAVSRPHGKIANLTL
jgi:hypothetical protein